MRIRLEGDAHRCYQFLADQKFPNLDGNWTVETLKDYCIIVRIEDAEGRTPIPKTAGYIWAQYTDDLDLVLDFHVCVAPAYRGKWFSVIPDLERLCGYLGAEFVTTKTVGDARLQKLVTELLVRRHGFIRRDESSVIKFIG